MHQAHHELESTGDVSSVCVSVVLLISWLVLLVLLCLFLVKGSVSWCAQAFSWNNATHGRGGPAGQAAAALDPLCPICTAPLTDAEVDKACQAAVRPMHMPLQAWHSYFAGAWPTCLGPN